MVVLLRLASLLFAVLLIVIISSLLAASHVIHGTKTEPQKLELLTSSNYTQTKNHQKRQSYYNPANNKGTLVHSKKPYRDLKNYYMDESDRNTYIKNTENDVRQQQQQMSPITETENTDNEQNYSASYVPVYRSRYHADSGMLGGSTVGQAPPFLLGYPELLGYPGFGGPGGGVTNPHSFGHAPMNPMAGGSGHAMGHSINILDPLFLMVTLSFILFLIHSVLGLVDRIRLPIVSRARMDDGIGGDSEVLDKMFFELREAIKKHQGVEKKEQAGPKYDVK